MIFLDPCNDVAFKKIFGSEAHKRVTISFLNSILEFTGDRAITDVQFMPTEQKRMMKDKKDNILDILCTDQLRNQYIIEIQVRGVKDFQKRMLFYVAKTYVTQLEFSKSYRKLLPVIGVAILGYTLFPEKEKYKSIYQMQDIQTHECDFDGISIAVVELPKFKKEENQLVNDEDKWLYFLKKIDKQDHVPAPLAEDAFEEACQTATRMTWTDEEMNAYYDSFIRATDEEGALELATEKGEKRGELKVAIKLLKAGVDINTIAVTTDLSIEQIKALREKK